MILALEFEGRLVRPALRRAGGPAPISRLRRWLATATRCAEPGTVCGSSAILARTLPGTLPATDLHFGIASRQFRATTVCFDVVLLRSFRSLFPLCAISASLSEGRFWLTRTPPWTLFAAAKARRVSRVIAF